MTGSAVQPLAEPPPSPAPSSTDYVTAMLKWLEQGRNRAPADQDPLWFLVNKNKVANLAALTAERTYDEQRRRAAARRLAMALP